MNVRKFSRAWGLATLAGAALLATSPAARADDARDSSSPAQASQPAGPSESEPASAPEVTSGPSMPVPAVIVRSPFRVSRPVGMSASAAASVLPAPASTMPGPGLGHASGGLVAISQPAAPSRATPVAGHAPGFTGLAMGPVNEPSVGTAVTFHTGALLGSVGGAGLGYTRVSSGNQRDYRIAQPGVMQAASAHPGSVRVSLLPTAGGGKVARFSIITPTSVVVTGVSGNSEGGSQ